MASRTCPSCNGTGNPQKAQCPICNGSGQKQWDPKRPPETCPGCDGSGQTTTYCPTCGGSGSI